MKRNRIGSGSPVYSGGFIGPEEAALSRVGHLRTRLAMDALKHPLFPADGPVGPFFTNDSYALQEQDQQTIVDWCVKNSASFTLGWLMGHWQPACLSLSDVKDLLVIEEAVPEALALEQPIRCLTLKHCSTLDGADRNDPERSADSDDEAGRAAKVLASAAWVCEEIVLEHCSMFSGAELQDWLAQAAEACALQRLSLCAVSGFDGAVVQQLAGLLLCSRIHTLTLGQVKACEQASLQALANAIAGSALSSLSLNDGDVGFVHGLLRALAQCEQLGQLATLRVSLTVVRSQQPLHAGQHMEALTEVVKTLCERFPQLQIDADIRFRAALDDPRITDSPQFLLDLGQRLWFFNRDAPLKEGQAFQAQLPPEAALGVAYYLSEGKGWEPKWLQLIDKHHRDSWASAYESEWSEQGPRPLQRIHTLLEKRDVAGLFWYAARLRARKNTPSADRLNEVFAGFAQDAELADCCALAFNARRAIERATNEGCTEDVIRYAGILRQHGQLLTGEQLEGALDLALNDPELLQAVWACMKL